MAGILDPFNPGTDNTPFAGVDPGTFDNIRQQWGTFLDDPKGRAALLSAGLALMQPPNFGDNAASQLGRAIGAGGESARAIEAQDLKKSEADSKDALREASASAKLTSADAATARAEAAGARAGAAGDRLGYQQQRLQDMQERANLQGRLRASIGYQNYVNKENSARLLEPNRPPPMDRDAWMRANGLEDILTPRPSGTSAPAEEDLTPVPAAADTTSRPTLSAADQQALQWANANPADPRAARIKARLGVQ
jgi:hypothetical protein